MVSGYPTSTSIPRVDGLSTDPREMGRHNEHGEIVLEIVLNGFLNVNGIYDKSFYAFFGFPLCIGYGNSRWLLLIE